MKSKFNMDPVIGVFVLVAAIIATLMVLHKYTTEDQPGFKEACLTMGGVPLIGYGGTKVCLKTDVVLTVI